jgi:hypothetical protein
VTDYNGKGVASMHMSFPNSKFTSTRFYFEVEFYLLTSVGTAVRATLKAGSLLRFSLFYIDMLRIYVGCGGPH